MRAFGKDEKGRRYMKVFGRRLTLRRWAFAMFMTMQVDTIITYTRPADLPSWLPALALGMGEWAGNIAAFITYVFLIWLATEVP